MNYKKLLEIIRGRERSNRHGNDVPELIFQYCGAGVDFKEVAVELLKISDLREDLFNSLPSSMGDVRYALSAETDCKIRSSILSNFSDFPIINSMSEIGLSPNTSWFILLISKDNFELLKDIYSDGNFNEIDLEKIRDADELYVCSSDRVIGVSSDPYCFEYDVSIFKDGVVLSVSQVVEIFRDSILDSGDRDVADKDLSFLDNQELVVGAVDMLAASGSHTLEEIVNFFGSFSGFSPKLLELFEGSVTGQEKLADKIKLSRYAKTLSGTPLGNKITEFIGGDLLKSTSKLLVSDLDSLVTLLQNDISLKKQDVIKIYKRLERSQRLGDRIVLETVSLDDSDKISILGDFDRINLWNICEFIIKDGGGVDRLLSAIRDCQSREDLSKEDIFRVVIDQDLSEADIRSICSSLDISPVGKYIYDQEGANLLKFIEHRRSYNIDSIILEGVKYLSIQDKMRIGCFDWANFDKEDFESSFDVILDLISKEEVSSSAIEFISYIMRHGSKSQIEKSVDILAKLSFAGRDGSHFVNSILVDSVPEELKEDFCNRLAREMSPASFNKVSNILLPYMSGDTKEGIYKKIAKTVAGAISVIKDHKSSSACRKVAIKTMAKSVGDDIRSIRGCLSEAEASLYFSLVDYNHKLRILRSFPEFIESYLEILKDDEKELLEICEYYLQLKDGVSKNGVYKALDTMIPSYIRNRSSVSLFRMRDVSTYIDNLHEVVLSHIPKSKLKDKKYVSEIFKDFARADISLDFSDDILSEDAVLVRSYLSKSPDDFINGLSTDLFYGESGFLKIGLDAIGDEYEHKFTEPSTDHISSCLLRVVNDGAVDLSVDNIEEELLNQGFDYLYIKSGDINAEAIFKIVKMLDSNKQAGVLKSFDSWIGGWGGLVDGVDKDLIASLCIDDSDFFEFLINSLNGYNLKVILDDLGLLDHYLSFITGERAGEIHIDASSIPYDISEMVFRYCLYNRSANHFFREVAVSLIPKIGIQGVFEFLRDDDDFQFVSDNVTSPMSALMAKNDISNSYELFQLARGSSFEIPSSLFLKAARYYDTRGSHGSYEKLDDFLISNAALSIANASKIFSHYSNSSNAQIKRIVKAYSEIMKGNEILLSGLLINQGGAFKEYAGRLNIKDSNPDSVLKAVVSCGEDIDSLISVCDVVNGYDFGDKLQDVSDYILDLFEKTGDPRVFACAHDLGVLYTSGIIQRALSSDKGVIFQKIGDEVEVSISIGYENELLGTYKISSNTVDAEYPGVEDLIREIVSKKLSLHDVVGELDIPTMVFSYDQGEIGVKDKYKVYAKDPSDNELLNSLIAFENSHKLPGRIESIGNFDDLNYRVVVDLSGLYAAADSYEESDFLKSSLNNTIDEIESSFDEILGKLSGDKPFGIEIEYSMSVERYKVAEMMNESLAKDIIKPINDYVTSKGSSWDLKYDGSIKGKHSGELVSPKLYGEEGLGELERILDEVDKIRSSGVEMSSSSDFQCGIHVHHDARDILENREIIESMKSALYKIQEPLYAICEASRSRNSFCSKANMSPKGVDLSNRGGFNITSYGTVEFRMREGMNDKKAILRWVRITKAVMDHVRSELREALQASKDQAVVTASDIFKALSVEKALQIKSGVDKDSSRFDKAISVAKLFENTFKGLGENKAA